MKIVAPSFFFSKEMSFADSIARVGALGYDGIDLSIGGDRNQPLVGSEWKEYAAMVRAAAEKAGVATVQSHLPGEISLPQDFLKDLIRGLGEIGVGSTVAHPIWIVDGRVIYDEDEFFSLNLPIYKELTKAAEEAGVVLMCENLCWGPSMDPVAMSKMVKEINSPYFGWCFDTGHANIFDINAASLKGLVTPYSLHIHDNHGGKEGDRERRHASMYTDEHLPPFDGTIDWQSFAKALTDIGYKGEFVLEAGCPDGVDVYAYLRDLLERSRRIMAMIPQK